MMSKLNTALKAGVGYADNGRYNELIDCTGDEIVGEFGSSAEDLKEIAKIVNSHDDVMSALKATHKLIAQSCKDGYAGEELFLNQDNLARFLREAG